MLAITALATFVLATGLFTALKRWTIADPAMRDSVVEQVEAASGLSMTATGPVTLRLFPRPVLTIAGVSLEGVAGAVSLEADAMAVRLDLLALMHRQIEIVGTAFESPTGVVNLDRLQPLLDALFRHAATSPLLGLMHTPGLTFHGGVVRLISADPRRDTTLTEITGTLAWPGGDRDASLTGSATWHGVPGEILLDVDRPDDVAKGGQALISLRVKSPMLDLDAMGNLSGSGEVRAAGKVTASTPDLPAFLRLTSTPAPQLDGVHQARLTGAASLTADTLSLDDAAINLDTMLFDGAIAVRRSGERTSLAGTLATDHLDLEPFLRVLPSFTDAGGRWSAAALGTRSIAYDDIDLRVSASSASMGSLKIEDGSLSLQSGDGRLELSLAEARAYDGLMKGRVVATVDGATTDLRAEATLSRLDLAWLLKEMPDASQASGIVTGHMAVESHGPTLAALVQGLRGRGELTMHNGEIGSRLLADLLGPGPGPKDVPLAAGIAGTPFDSASFDIRVKDGLAVLTDSVIRWPNAHAAVFGSACLLGQTLDVSGAVTADETPDKTTTFDLTGPWRSPQLTPARLPF